MDFISSNLTKKLNTITGHFKYFHFFLRETPVLAQKMDKLSVGRKTVSRLKINAEILTS